MLDTGNNFRKIIGGIAAVNHCAHIEAVGCEEYHTTSCQFFNIFAD